MHRMDADSMLKRKSFPQSLFSLLLELEKKWIDGIQWVKIKVINFNKHIQFFLIVSVNSKS